MYLDREDLFLDPVYQRSGDIWTPDKRRLLIDSIINNFDIPKFYWHQFEKPEEHGDALRKFAVIDGKQRLGAIRDFMENKLRLSADIEYLKKPSVRLANLNYGDLSEKYPDIKARFDAYSLTVVKVRTTDMELIEDMFSRLNEAVPLSAAEKRNAFGKLMPPVIRGIAKAQFFVHCVPFPNKRYRHFDVACKFLYMLSRERVDDTRKTTLDVFVRDFGNTSAAKKLAVDLQREAQAVLRAMAKIFGAKDSLLRNVGDFLAYFELFRRARTAKVLPQITRAKFEKLEKAIRDNRIAAEEEDISRLDMRLRKYDEVSRTINDGSSIRLRYNVLVEQMGLPLEKVDE